MVRHHPWPWWWSKEKDRDESRVHNQKLAVAGFAGLLATGLLHPLDLLKVRIQIAARPYTLKFMFRRVVLSEGYKGLYKGLAAGLFKQTTSTLSKLGVYNYLNESSKTNNNRPLRQSSISDRVRVGVYGGMAGAVAGNPAELLLIRMMASSRCPGSAHQCVRDLQRRPYRSCVDGLTRIVREEGFFTLWRGTTFTLLRSVLIMSAQIYTYLYIRQRIIERGIFPEDSKMSVHISSCIVSSFISAVLSLPVDVVKSWYQIRRRGSSIHETVACLTGAKGKLFLWSGFIPYYLRMVAYTIATYYILTEFTEFLEAINEEVEKQTREALQRKYVPLMKDTLRNFKRYLLRRAGKMFNLYQHMKNNEEKTQREPEYTGHDRFYQERSRSSYRRKRRRGGCRRAQSAAELNPDSIAAANRRNAFRIRSVSTDKEDSEEDNNEKTPLVAQKIDSLAKLLFNKSIIGSGKSSPSESRPASPKVERTIESTAALAICTEYLGHTSRYDLISQLGPIGSTYVPLPSKYPQSGEFSRSVVMELFLALHHPYICPVLDLEIRNHHALTVLPFNQTGSLKDLIYKSTWNEDYTRKYATSPAMGLPAWQVARFGRQLLEGLLFLREKGFLPFTHLHSGNVVVQNGVARICGLEHTLIGSPPLNPIAAGAPLDRVEALTLGAVLFEMCVAADFDLQLLQDLPAEYANIVEQIEVIFGPRPPTLQALVLCEVFRKIDLRELRGSCLPNFNQRLSRSCLCLLGSVSRRYHTPPSTPPARRRHYALEQDYTEVLQW